MRLQFEGQIPAAVRKHIDSVEYVFVAASTKTEKFVAAVKMRGDVSFSSVFPESKSVGKIEGCDYVRLEPGPKSPFAARLSSGVVCVATDEALLRDAMGRVKSGKKATLNSELMKMHSEISGYDHGGASTTAQLAQEELQAVAVGLNVGSSISARVLLVTPRTELAEKKINEFEAMKSAVKAGMVNAPAEIQRIGKLIDNISVSRSGSMVTVKGSWKYNELKDAVPSLASGFKLPDFAEGGGFSFGQQMKPSQPPVIKNRPVQPRTYQPPTRTNPPGTRPTGRTTTNRPGMPNP